MFSKENAFYTVQMTGFSDIFSLNISERQNKLIFRENRELLFETRTESAGVTEIFSVSLPFNTIKIL